MIILFIIGLLIFLITLNRFEHFSSQKKNNNEYFKNKVILITGSTNGLGYDLAKVFSKYECKLVITGKNKEKVKKVQDELREYNKNVIGVQADFLFNEETKNLFKQVILNYKTIDILINIPVLNIGSRSLTRKKLQDWKDEVSVNVDSVYILTQLAIEEMKYRKNNGRILNVTTKSVKLVDSNTNSGSDILTKNLIERYTNIVAEENYKYKIAVATVRLDGTRPSKILSKLSKKFPSIKDMGSTIKGIDQLLDIKTDKLIPVFIYAIKAPFHEISGKVISSSSYNENPKLSKILPSHQLKLSKNIYKKVVHTPENKNASYLVKQNLYGHSNKIEKLMQNGGLRMNNINKFSKHKPKIASLIISRNKIKSENLCLFKTEYDALDKVLDLFVPKYQEAVTHFPCWPYLYLSTKEKKITMKYILLKEEELSIQPNLKKIKGSLTTKTKLIYLSSPNTVTGQQLETSDFEEIMKDIPDNIIILIDQRFYDFSSKNNFDPIKYINRYNILILRSFNNFYGIENLEMAYLIGNSELIEFIKDTQIIDPIDNFNDQLAVVAYNDNVHNSNIRKRVETEKNKMINMFIKNNIKYFPSDTSYLLVETPQKRDEVSSFLKKENIILYESNDTYNGYWTLPISDSETNSKVLDVLMMNS